MQGLLAVDLSQTLVCQRYAATGYPYSAVGTAHQTAKILLRHLICSNLHPMTGQHPISLAK